MDVVYRPTCSQNMHMCVYVYVLCIYVCADLCIYIYVCIYNVKILYRTILFVHDFYNIQTLGLVLVH